MHITWRGIVLWLPNMTHDVQSHKKSRNRCPSNRALALEHIFVLSISLTAFWKRKAKLQYVIKNKPNTRNTYLDALNLNDWAKNWTWSWLITEGPQPYTFPLERLLWLILNWLYSYHFFIVLFISLKMIFLKFQGINGKKGQFSHILKNRKSF